MASGGLDSSNEDSRPPGEDKSGLSDGDWRANAHEGSGGQGSVHSWVKVDCHQKFIDRIAIKDSWSTEEIEEPERYRGIYEELVRKGMSMSDAIFEGSSRIPFYKEAYIQGLLTPESRATETGTVRMRGYRRGNANDPRGVPGSIHWRIYMDHCYAGDLWNIIEYYLREGMPIPESFIWYVMESLAYALVQMETCARARPHAREQKDETIVLLDMKPPNILLDMAGQNGRYPVYPRLRVSDFGSAHITYKDDPENIYNRLELTVTPGFQAPELDRPAVAIEGEEMFDEDEDEGDSDDEDRGDSESDQGEGGLPARHALGDLGAYKATKTSAEGGDEGSTDHDLGNLGAYKITKASNQDEDEKAIQHHGLDDSKSPEEEGGLPAHYDLGNLGAYKLTKTSDEYEDEEPTTHQDLDDSSSDEDENMHVEVPDIEPYDEMDVWESVGHGKTHDGSRDEEAGKKNSRYKEARDEEDEEDEDEKDRSEQEEDQEEGDEEDGDESFTPLYSWTNVWHLGRTIEVMMRTDLIDDCDWDDPDGDKESKIRTDPPDHPDRPEFLYSEDLTEIVWQCQQFDPESRPTPTALLDMIKSISPFHNERMDVWGTEDWVQEQYDHMGTLTEDHKKFMKASIKQRAADGKLWFLDDFEDPDLATRYRELDIDLPENCELIWQPKKFRHRVGQMFGAEESESESEPESSERSKNNKRPRTNEAITMTPVRKKQKI